jgi:RNA polymerase II-associated factor 1
MPPTVNPPQNAADRRRPGSAGAGGSSGSGGGGGPGERRTDLVYRVKYCNTLPDIPFDPKFIQYPFDNNR